MIVAILPFTLQFWIVEGEQLVREAEDVGLLLLGHSEHRRQDPERMRRSDVDREVALALAGGAGEAVDGLASAALDHRVELGDRLRCEHSTRDPAVGPVLGRVHRDDRAHRCEGTRLQCLVLGGREYRDPRRRAEPLGRGGDLEDVVVLGERPERLEAGRLAAVDGRLGAQSGPQLVGRPVGCVPVRRDQVEPVSDVHGAPKVKSNDDAVLNVHSKSASSEPGGRAHGPNHSPG
jgi:hypothetical protein